MKKATRGEGSLPLGNWIYQFATFREIIDAVKTTLDLSGNLKQKTLRVNLVHELESNMRAMMVKSESKAVPLANFTEDARKLFPGVIDGSTTFPVMVAASFSYFALNMPVVVNALSTSGLTTAVESGEFLEFNKSSGRHVVGSFQRSLIAAISEINSLRRYISGGTLPEALSEILKQVRAVTPKVGFNVSVQNSALLSPMQCVDTVVNLHALTKALHRFLTGKDAEFQQPVLKSKMPVFQSVVDNPRVEVTDEEVRSCL